MARQRRRKQRGGGELESAVIGVLWDHGGWMTPGEVHEVLGDGLAYNTVLTILVRLSEKQRLERQRDGRSYAYRPLLSREEYVAARMSTVLGEAKDRSAAMVGFLESLDDRERTQ
ncbi:MAG: BlaI/MecI/CopY family transcriptional regulator, partial [Acidimicrobiales bacterium]